MLTTRISIIKGVLLLIALLTITGLGACKPTEAESEIASDEFVGPRTEEEYARIEAEEANRQEAVPLDASACSVVQGNQEAMDLCQRCLKIPGVTSESLLYACMTQFLREKDASGPYPKFNNGYGSPSYNPPPRPGETFIGPADPKFVPVSDPCLCENAQAPSGVSDVTGLVNDAFNGTKLTNIGFDHAINANFCRCLRAADLRAECRGKVPQGPLQACYQAYPGL